MEKNWPSRSAEIFSKVMQTLNIFLVVCVRGGGWGGVLFMTTWVLVFSLLRKAGTAWSLMTMNFLSGLPSLACLCKPSIITPPAHTVVRGFCFLTDLYTVLGRAVAKAIMWFIGPPLGQGGNRYHFVIQFEGGWVTISRWNKLVCTKFKHLKREVKKSWVRGVRIILSWGRTDVVWGREQEKKGDIVTHFQHLLCVETEVPGL